MHKTYEERYGIEKMKLKNKIIFTALFPLLVLDLVLGLITILSLRNTTLESTYDGLHSTALSVREYITNIDPGAYEVKGGALFKGSSHISGHYSFVDEIVEESHVDVSVFYGNERFLTSIKTKDGERITGSSAPESLYTKVATDKNVFFSENMDIAGTEYVCCYIPLFYNGESVGMIFAGKTRDNTFSGLAKTQNFFMLVSVVVVAMATISVVIISSKTVKRIKVGINVMEKLADGDLTVKVKKSALASKDETGEITRAVVKLRNKLSEIVGSIVGYSDALRAEAETLSANTTRTLDSVSQVDYAVNEIANGASSQAEETQNATSAVLEMGELISQTVEESEKLAALSDNMIESSNEVLEHLNNLDGINKQAQQAIEEIYVQTNTTNESALKIQEATHMITAIADETNLLALNASIEAARAGEAGKGFAVVASEIQKLAEQSNASANEISEIIALLIEDSNTAVETMNNVKEVMNVQSESVTRTNELFNAMKEDMNTSVDSIKVISKHAQVIDESRLTVVDVVQNLSAIAEENAASTEETSASITEVKELSEYIGERAERLDDVSADLSESMKIFKCNNN